MLCLLLETDIAPSDTNPAFGLLEHKAGSPLFQMLSTPVRKNEEHHYRFFNQVSDMHHMLKIASGPQRPSPVAPSWHMQALRLRGQMQGLC